MVEFLIRRTDDEWFDFHKNLFEKVFSSKQIEIERIEGWGDYRIKALDCEISFSDEDVGIQIYFEGENVNKAFAISLVKEFCENIETITGQQTKIIEL